MAPASAEDLIAVVAESRVGKAPLDVTGRGSKTGYGRVMQTARSVSTVNLHGITLYEPSEMVIGARSGTPLEDVITTLDENGQMLPFEPRALGTFFGTGSNGTIGAVAATNLSGSKRVYSGATRDHLIGVTAVTGRAEMISSGGRVMKNVTGYDLVKLYAGSFGTLGILTEVFFKVHPKPETQISLVYEGLDDRRAVSLLCAAMGTPYEVTGAAHVPGHDGQPSRTLLRIEGFAFSVDYRSAELIAELRGFGTPGKLDQDTSLGTWSSIADLAVLPAADGDAVWQISTAPSRGPDIADQLRGSTDVELFYDWSGGLLIAATPPTSAAAAAVTAAVVGSGGHATLLRGPSELRAHVDVFHPLPEPVMEMTRRIKAEFDPDHVLNPGKMYAGV